MDNYDCPVYKYPRRTDKYFIFDVKLPCVGTGPHRWKLRGVALLCSTEWEKIINILYYFFNIKTSLISYFFKILFNNNLYLFIL